MLRKIVEVVTRVRTGVGLERYLAQHGKHNISLFKSESRCSKSRSCDVAVRPLRLPFVTVCGNLHFFISTLVG